MELAVILPGAAVRNDLELLGVAGDAQLADLGGDDVVGILVACFLGVLDVVVNLTVVGDTAGGLDAADLAFNEAVAGDGDIGTGERGAVVFLGRALAGESDGARIDGQGAVGNDEGDLTEVFVLALKVACGKTHRVRGRPGVGSGDRRIAGECKVAFLVEAAADAGHFVAGDGLFGAVILLGAGVAGDVDNNFGRVSGDGESTGLSDDNVVAGLEVLALGEGDGIGDAALVGYGAGGLDVADLAVNEAFVGDGDIGAGERGTVIGLIGALTGQSDLAFGDGQSAVLDLTEGVEVGDVGLAAHDLVGLDNVCAAAGVGLAAFDDCGKHVALGEDVLREVVAGLGERLTVVGLVRTLCGDVDHAGVLGDDQFAVFLSDGVVVSLGAFGQRVCEPVLAAALIGLAAGDVVGRTLACDEAAAADGDGGIGERSAVIFLFTTAGGERYGTRGDGERALLACTEGVVVGDVNAVARDLVGLDDVVAAALIGLAANDFDLKLVTLGELTGVGVAAVGDCLAAVDLGLAVRGDDNLGGNCGDGQVAVFLGDLVVLCLGVVIQLVVEGVLAAADIELAAGDGVGCAFAINEAVAGDGDIMVGERDTVIHLAVGCGGESYLTLGDGQRAVLDDKLNIGEVIADVLKVFGNKLHVIAAGIGAGDSGIAGEVEVISGVERIADLGVVAGDGLFAAVILCSAAVLLDRDNDLVGDGCNRQGTGVCSDIVVVGVGALVQSVAEGVRAAACEGLTAGDGVGCAFAISEALAGDGDIMVGERGTVILFAAVCGGESYLTLGDAQSAVNGSCKGVVSGDVRAVVAHDLIGLNNVSAAAGVGLAALDGYMQYIAAEEDALSEGVSAVGKRGAVISLGVAVSGDGDYV